MRALLSIALLLALALPFANAQPEVASFRDGRFSAILAFTENSDEFLQEWTKPPQPGFRPRLQSSRKVGLGKPVTGFIFFGNCPNLASSPCLLKADLVVSRADGRVVETKVGIPVWTNMQAPPAQGVVLGEARITLKFDQPDEVGRYRISVQLREESTGLSGSLSWNLEVTE
jgi:hypothetical protein